MIEPDGVAASQPAAITQLSALFRSEKARLGRLACSGNLLRSSTGRWDENKLGRHRLRIVDFKQKVVKSPKYADGTGNTWGGMGKRPVWIHEALAAGKSLEDFLISKPESAALGKSKPAKTHAKPKAPPQTAAVSKKRAPKKAAVKRSTRSKAAQD